MKLEFPFQPTDHAKVDKGESSIIQDENIAWMWVSMKKAVDQHLLQDGIGPVVGKGLEVVPRLSKSGEFRDFDSLDEFQGQNGLS